MTKGVYKASEMNCTELNLLCTLCKINYQFVRCILLTLRWNYKLNCIGYISLQFSFVTSDTPSTQMRFFGLFISVVLYTLQEYLHRFIYRANVLRTVICLALLMFYMCCV